ncbi:MAG: hypothetical protein KTR22_08965 [Flavobacteriaceae bacterium]|nr:hypothetical protein [Flavobacteriaceae bacterium]
MKNLVVTLFYAMQDDASMREDYFLGAALVAMIIIAIIFLFAWSRRHN